nr:PREDICTED: alkaline ceramidase 3-like [Phalacrocorax carbo]
MMNLAGKLVTMDEEKAEIMYGTLVSIIVLRSVYIVLWVYPWLRGLGYTSLTVFLMGFFLWNVDNIFCDKLRALRERMPPVVGAVTQFHAWWHILTGLGSYLHILLSLYTRTLFLKHRPKVKFVFGIWPVLLVEPPKKL